MNMTFLTAKSLPRRTVLRGLGATVALPFLEAMIPARRGIAIFSMIMASSVSFPQASASETRHSW